MPDIDDRALDSLSVAPPEGSNQDRDPRQDAGRDESIARRLEKDPDNPDAQLDAALDESMDASDPPSNTQPGGEEPPRSSGFDPDRDGSSR